MVTSIIGAVYIIVVFILFVAAMILGNYIRYWTIRLYEFIRKQKSQEALPRIFDKTTKYLAFILFLGISFAIPYFTMPHFGHNYAQAMTKFTTLKDGGEHTPVLIYQHEGMGIVKEYNTTTKEFLSGYEVINLVGNKFVQSENLSTR